MAKFTIGADPELFVVEGDTVTYGIGRIGGSKKQPLPVDKGAVQEDNVLAEFNIEPASNVQEFVSNLATVVGELGAILNKQGLGLLCKASHIFTVDDLEPVLDKAFEFGCDPDFNCWTGEANTMPTGVHPGLRTAGGHVHIGYDGADAATSMRIAQACEYMLGLPSVLADADEQRKELYGKAGACRVKPYGVEYRVLSNFWLQTEALQQWAYAQAVKAGECAMDGSLDYIMGVVSPDEVQRIINDNDKGAAADAVAALAEFGVVLPE